MLALVLLFVASCDAVRPCASCCEHSDSCVYASKASKYVNITHTCCGSTLFGVHYCCPESVENVSLVCKGTMGKCSKVSRGMSWMLPIMGIFFVCLGCLSSLGEEREQRHNPIMAHNDIHYNENDADWG